MEFFNYKKFEKVFLLIFTILFVSLFISSIYELICKDFDVLTFILFIISAITSIVFSIIILITFSSKTILQKDGVIYKTIFRTGFHRWDEVHFVAEYELTLHPISPSFNGIICSFDLEKNEIKFRHFATGAYICNKHYLCFPCSEEVKDFLIVNLPYGKYLGLAFTDESFNII